MNNGKKTKKACTSYLASLDFHLLQDGKTVSPGSGLVFALKTYDTLTKARKTDYEKKACEALKRILGVHRVQLKSWTDALKGGFVMDAMGGKRRKFDVVTQIVENVWSIVEDFDELFS